MSKRWEREVKTEAARAVAWMNDRVVPRVRRESLAVMRTAAVELRRLAAKLDAYGSRRA